MNCGLKSRTLITAGESLPAGTLLSDIIGSDARLLGVSLYTTVIGEVATLKINALVAGLFSYPLMTVSTTGTANEQQGKHLFLGTNGRHKDAASSVTVSANTSNGFFFLAPPNNMKDFSPASLRDIQLTLELVLGAFATAIFWFTEDKPSFANLDV